MADDPYPDILAELTPDEMSEACARGETFLLIGLEPGPARKVVALPVNDFEMAVDLSSAGVRSGSFVPTWIEAADGFIVCTARDIFLAIDAVQQAILPEDEVTKHAYDFSPGIEWKKK